MANGLGAAATVTSLIAQEISAGAKAAEFGALSAGLGVTVAYGVAPLPSAGGIPGSLAAAAAAGVLAGNSAADAVVLAAELVGAGSTVAGVAAQVAAQTISHTQHELAVYVDTLPECNTEFTGTVTLAAAA